VPISESLGPFFGGMVAAAQNLPLGDEELTSDEELEIEARWLKRTKAGDTLTEEAYIAEDGGRRSRKCEL